MKSVYPIGKMVYEYRTRKGISQEQLCGDILAVSTLARIERGQHRPDIKTAEYLFTRLGLAAPAGLVPMTKVEYERFCIEVQILRKISAGQHDIKELLVQYKKIDKKLNLLEEQFYLFSYALYANSEEKLAHDATRNLLINAMKLTLKNYTLDLNLEGYFFSEIEVLILNNIARETYEMGEQEKGIKQMMFLKQYLENPKIEDSLKNTMYTIIIFNLTNWLGLAGRHKEALELAEKGILFNSIHGDLIYFPFHIFNKGYCLSMLGQKDEGKKYIDLAYRNFEVMGRHELVVQTASEVNRLFGFNFKED